VSLVLSCLWRDRDAMGLISSRAVEYVVHEKSGHYLVLHCGAVVSFMVTASWTVGLPGYYAL
jgi:hypothetical protein